MKQKIYEIPIWDAFELDNCECPICHIEKKIEDQFIETLFTEMVMDVNLNPQLVEDFRFCHEHFQKLYKYPDKCGLAILSDRILHLERKALSKISINKNRNNGLKIPLFKKSSSSDASHRKKCLLCSKLDKDMNDYMETMIKLWDKEERFKEKLKQSKGFCFKHFEQIISHKLATPLFQETCSDIQEKNLIRLQDELQWFITKYDYRYVNEPWKTSKDALMRTILKLIGNFDSKL